MPPLKGIDRGLNGKALKALEESGHGRRLAIVDASYRIPRWAETVDYTGESSASALKGILSLLPREDSEPIILMATDPGAPDKADSAGADFELALRGHFQSNVIGDYRYRKDEQQKQIAQDDGGVFEPGFYSVADNQKEDTLFVRTRDKLPYACATFVIGHSQTTE